MKPEIKESIDKAVLCWLATATPSGEPNVSPKEVFTTYGEDHIIVANIASPGTVHNIRVNPKICISFIDILVQKGFQIKGTAEIIDRGAVGFEELEPALLKITKGEFPFNSITKIKIEKVKPIIAPRYMLYPETTEAQQIENAKQIYRLSE